MEKTWKIFIKTYDSKGNLCGVGKYIKEYKYLKCAKNRAKQFPDCCRCIITQDDVFDELTEEL